MDEELSTSKKESIILNRLRALIGDKYIIKQDRSDIYIQKESTNTILEKTWFHKTIRNVTSLEQLAHIEGLWNRNNIYVYDKSLYDALKQFGNEYGYNHLIKGWEGAELEAGANMDPAIRPKPNHKMEETTMKPR
jgi:hypothetical protein